jgi:hypothetical protein
MGCTMGCLALILAVCIQVMTSSWGHVTSVKLLDDKHVNPEKNVAPSLQGFSCQLQTKFIHSTVCS